MLLADGWRGWLVHDWWWVNGSCLVVVVGDARMRWLVVSE